MVGCGGRGGDGGGFFGSGSGSDAPGRGGAELLKGGGGGCEISNCVPPIGETFAPYTTPRTTPSAQSDTSVVASTASIT